VETPPPFEKAPRGRGPGLTIALVLGAIGVCCVVPILAVVFGGFFMVGKVQGMASCSITMSAAQRAILDYEKDKGSFPSTENWQTAIAPYYDKAIENINTEGNPFKAQKATDAWVCNNEGAVTGIAYNSDIAGKKLADFKDKMQTVVLYEIEKSKLNAAAPYKELPQESSPKMFGTPRGWIKVTLDEDTEVEAFGGAVKVDGESKSAK
jgi:hypothetical protein